MRAMVVGLGVTGRAVVPALLRRGWEVCISDDHPTEATRRGAADLGVELFEAPSPATLAALARAADQVVVSPGVPASHPVFSLPGPGVVSEIEMASRWARAPLVAVTGTNGKTTVVTMVTRMLLESGLRAVAAGNIGLPLAEAVDEAADVLVVEVSSFQLALTSTFRPAVSAWLNLAEDHLDWHPDMDHYRSSKARIWAQQGADDVVVLNADDPEVMAAADGPEGTRSRRVTFGAPGADFSHDGNRLLAPGGELVVDSSDLRRDLPHDIANALASTAVAHSAGADLEACRRVLRSFAGLAHRVALVGRAGGVAYFDDSKATTPASVLAALAGFESVVLLAGGQNKGLDLGVLRKAVDRIRCVVAIGQAASEVEAAFDGLRPVHRAQNMSEAVAVAVASARPGDAVLLSPGCASFDWYGSYAERGDDFSRLVHLHMEGVRP